MINDTIEWKDIYEQWRFILGCYQVNLSFPCSNSYFIEIKIPKTEDIAYDFIAWWDKNSIDDDYKKLNRSDFLAPNERMLRSLMGYRDIPKYYDTAQIFFDYKDNVENTALLWLYTLCLYYSSNSLKLLLPNRQREEFLHALHVESRNRDLPRTNPGRSKYILPISIKDVEHLSSVFSIKSLDDLIAMLFYDVCFILEHYQMVHVITV
ncbi:MAG TPA: hypothetical protein PKJ47_11920 [Candidatus Limiplasma sp.]|nr:hypothetical protein [Candidatus Limiplasma sp.]